MGRRGGGVGGGVGVGVRCGEDGLHPAVQTGPTERPHVLQIHRCCDNLHLSQTELGSLRGGGGSEVVIMMEKRSKVLGHCHNSVRSEVIVVSVAMCAG